jgi:hypothetical protein
MLYSVELRSRSGVQRYSIFLKKQQTAGSKHEAKGLQPLLSSSLFH